MAPRGSSEDSEERAELSYVIGESGRFQKITTVLCFYLLCTGGFLGVFAQFLAPAVVVQYETGGHIVNATKYMSTNCKWDDIISTEMEIKNTTDDVTLTFSSPYSRSFLTEKFQLVCENSWLISLISSVSMIGAVIGTMAIGQLSEIFGRRRLIVLLQYPAALANLCMLISQNYTVFVVACFFYGGANFSYALLAFVTLMEYVPTAHRPVYGVLSSFGIVVGQVVMAAATWILQDWYYVQLAQTVLVALPLVFTWYFVESPVWLVIRGKRDEAKEVLKTIAKRNHLDVIESENKIQLWIQSTERQRLLQSSAKTEGKLADLFKTPVMRKYTIYLTFILFCVFFIFYGLSMNMESFGSDLYEDVLISNSLSLVSMFICTLSLSRISIRKICFSCEAFLTAACFLYPFFHDYPVGRSVLSALVRFAVTPALNTAFTYVAEVIPTSVRGVGLGFISMASRSSSALSPFTKELGLKTARYVPFILFGVLALISAFLLIIVLPDTKGKPLTPTIADLEKTKRRRLRCIEK